MSVRDGFGEHTAAGRTCPLLLGASCHVTFAMVTVDAISFAPIRHFCTARGRAAPAAGLPFVDARLLVRAPRHQECIRVAPPVITLDFLQLCIEYAGRWVLAVLSRSIGICTPVLGSFNVLFAAVIRYTPAVVLRSSRSSPQPALAFHQGPMWLGGVAASISRAEPLPAGCVDTHVVPMAGAPRVAWTASSPRVMAVAAGGMTDGHVPCLPWPLHASARYRRRLPPTLARFATARLPALDGDGLHCFWASAEASAL